MVEGNLGVPDMDKPTEDVKSLPAASTEVKGRGENAKGHTRFVCPFCRRQHAAKAGAPFVHHTCGNRLVVKKGT